MQVKTSSFKIGIAGIGTVGTEVVNIINQADTIARNVETRLEVSMVSVRSLQTKRNCDLSGVTITNKPLDLVTSKEVHIVIELMGDVEAGLALIKAALLAGKPVITANKALLAKYADELFTLSEKPKVPLLFEAAVAAAIPIVKVMRESLVANRIERIVGIMNGTCNYILTRMEQEEIDYTNVLKDAQALGYAEADPTFDVEGIDAAHKLAILARLAFSQSIPFSEISHLGLSHINTIDFKLVKNLGYKIKPLGLANMREDGIELRVQPYLVKKNSLLGHVNGVLNAVEVTSEVATTSYFGPGAGGKATASAVVADLVEIAQAMEKDSLTSVYVPKCLEVSPKKILLAEDSQDSFYLRFHAQDKPGTLKQLTEALESHQISIEAVHQNEPERERKTAVITILTNRVNYKVMQDTVEEILSLDVFKADHCLIPIYH